MTLNSSLRNGPALWLIALFAVGGSSSFAQRSESNVPAAIQISKDLGRADAWSEINITVHSKLSDKAAFDQAVDDLYDPASPSFHQWMTNAGLRKYAPAESQRAMVRRELENHGLTLLSTDASGFSIRAPPAPSPARSATTNLWKLAPRQPWLHQHHLARRSWHL